MLENKIKNILEQDVRSLNCNIWGIEISGNNLSKNITIFIDKKDGLVTLDDCEKVNLQAREILDNSMEFNFNFSLEVSSPGIDRKFFDVNQLKDFIGQTVEVSHKLGLTKKIKTRGELKEVNKELVCLESQDGKLKILLEDYISSKLLGEIIWMKKFY